VSGCGGARHELGAALRSQYRDRRWGPPGALPDTVDLVGTRRHPWDAVQLATLRWRNPADAVALGDDLRARGDIAGARAAFQRAIDSGDPDIAAAGAWWMGTLLRDAGDPAGAGEHYRRVIGSGHPTWSLRAGIDLADLLQAHGDPTGAVIFYRAVVDSADPAGADGNDLWAHRAAVRLAVLLARQGDPAGAQDVQRRATGDGAAGLQVRFAVDRAEELRRQGDLDAAAASYREAIDLGGAQAPRVSFQLAILLRERGDLDGARAALRAAVDSGDPAVAAQAAAVLRSL
jgi:tetratricopeptide (TPR) repeat protein